MQSQWKQRYILLREYIKNNPEIHIDTGEISIPQKFRDKFYDLFDEIRNSIADEYYSSMPENVKTLCGNYIAAEKEALERLKIKQIEQPVDLIDFLRNPRIGIIRGIYNSLFELVQGKISDNDFEWIAGNDISKSIWDLYRLGYESWAAITLINTLEPDKIYRVDIDDDNEPCVSETDSIAFGRQFMHPSKRIPEFIIHSKKLDKYVAFKLPLAREVDTFDFPIDSLDKPRDRTGDTSLVMDLRVIFLTIIQDLNDIPVFADIHLHKVIKNPDLTIEFLTEQDFTGRDEIYQVCKRVQIMKPEKGGCIVIMDTEREKMDTGSDTQKPEFMENIKIIQAGLDPSNFKSIAEILA